MLAAGLHEGRYLYPDPPLGTEELALLELLESSSRGPHAHNARCAMTAAANAHESVLVGVSVSEPDEYDLVSLGLSELHVRHAFIEIARHLLAAGHSLAYGGDFRHHGYTEAMLDLVRTYSRHDRPGPERIRIYSAWPRWVDMSADERAGLAGVASLVSVDRPTGCPERLAVVPGRSANERLWAAIALTEMRRRMNRDIGARVVLGGRPSGQEGLLPGVVEEASLALAERTPSVRRWRLRRCRFLDCRRPARRESTRTHSAVPRVAHARLRGSLGIGRESRRPAQLRRIARSIICDRSREPGQRVDNRAKPRPHE